MRRSLNRCAVLLLCPAWIASAAQPEEEGVRRVRAHLLIEDVSSAVSEGQELFTKFSHSSSVGSVYIEALAAAGLDQTALETWRQISKQHPLLKEDRNLLEEVAWGVLRKGVESTQYGVRLAALIGAYLTQDVRAMKLLLKLMRDSNAVVRSIAVQMSTSFGDAPLKDEIARLIDEEKVWLVRLEVIRAAGALRMKSLAPKLQGILASEKNTFEERRLAIEALVRIYDQTTLEEIEGLAKSDRAGMRHLACLLAAHFETEGAKEAMVRLSADSNPNVRIAALNALGLVYLKQMSFEQAKETISKALQDSHPAVAITAAWAAALLDPVLGEKHLERWMKHELSEYRLLAAAALSTTGRQCLELAQKMLDTSQDPYVKANVAAGLIGQRVEVQKCCDILYDFVTKEKGMWMLDDRANPLFRSVAPSQVRHIDQIPNYPEAIDQMTRLQMVSLLALADDPRAQEALKGFLQGRSWGLTGVAAATLLQEGDEDALRVVRKLLEDSDPNVRLQACLVLALLGHDETVVVDLHKAYADADRERKLHILEALGRIGKEESYDFFMRAMEEPFPVLRVAAAAGMVQSLNR